MKVMLVILCILASSSLSLAQSDSPVGPAIIYSIDDYFTPEDDVEVSEEALPPEVERTLEDEKSFTKISTARAASLFNTLKSNPRARMRSPRGLCSRRRAYIQGYLKNLSIRSGKLLITCPGNNGRLRLRDRVSGRYYTYINYHDVNIVSTNAGYRVMDLQFQSGPVSLGSYLSEVERYQRLRPARNKEASAGICYWRISSP